MNRAAAARIVAFEERSAVRRAAVAGTSLVKSARRVLNTTTAPSYFEFRSACQFIEALLLHDRLILVGDLDDTDRRFVDDLKRRLGSEVIITCPHDVAWERLVDTPAIQNQVKVLLQKVFGRRAPAIGPRELNTRPTFTRFADDHQAELGRKIVDAAADADALTRVLYEEYVASLVARERKYFVNYLFRTFLYAAVATELRGTVVADGMRWLVLRLLQAKVGAAAPKTLSVRLYDAANEALRASMRPLVSDTSTPFIPLAVLFTLGPDNAARDVVERIQRARDRLSAYRDSTSAYQDTLLDADASIAERQAVYSEVVGAGAQYLSRITAQLSLHKLGVRGLIDKIWVNSVDSLFGSTEVSAGPEGGSLSLSGSAIGVARAARLSFAQQKRDHSFAELLNMINSVVTRDGVFTSVAHELRIQRSLESPEHTRYEEAAFPRALGA